jgi:hypothetical protein
MKPRTPATTVLAVLALVVALAGTSLAGYAAGKQSGDAVIKKKSLSGNRLKADTVTGKQVRESSLGVVPRAALADRVPTAAFTPLVLEDFTAYTANGYGAPGWRKDVSGFVHLEGHVESDSGELIATLPVGARPASRMNFVVPQNGAPAVVVLGPDGVLSLGAGGTFNVSLDGISFYAGP